MKKQKRKIPKLNSVMVLDVDKVKKTLDLKSYNKYYKKYEGKFFVFMGEIVQAPGHCILLDMDSRKVGAMYHTSEFRVVKDGEF